MTTKTAPREAQREALTAGMTSDAYEILTGPIRKEKELCQEFLTALEGELIFRGIENTATFASILHFALENGLVRQHLLAEKLRYANSQVGRWAAGKAAPPMIVRERVIEIMRDMMRADLADYEAQEKRAAGLARAANG